MIGSIGAESRYSTGYKQPKTKRTIISGLTLWLRRWIRRILAVERISIVLRKYSDDSLSGTVRKNDKHFGKQEYSEYESENYRIKSDK